MAKPYIAIEPIDIGNARGYNPGDVVADDVVERHGLQDSVSREGSRSAQEAVKPEEPAKP